MIITNWLIISYSELHKNSCQYISKFIIIVNLKAISRMKLKERFAPTRFVSAVTIHT